MGQERPEVRVTVREGGETYTDVALHPKGAAGSFRAFDDKPAMTLNFSKHKKGRTFHGYAKISLNNSVQDRAIFRRSSAGRCSWRRGFRRPRWSTPRSS